MTLKEVKPGNSVTIRRLNSTGSVKKKLMDMGLTKNTEVYIRKVAPLGDPIELTVRGYELIIRKADAALIEVCLLYTSYMHQK